MKAILYSSDARRALHKHRNQALRLIQKIERYAQTGAGDVTQLVGSTALRLRIGDFRVISEETAEEIRVTRIAPRGSAYDEGPAL